MGKEPFIVDPEEQVNQLIEFKDISFIEGRIPVIEGLENCFKL